MGRLDFFATLQKNTAYPLPHLDHHSPLIIMPIHDQPLPTDDIEALEQLHTELSHKLRCNEALIKACTHPVKAARLFLKIERRRLQINALFTAIHMERVLTSDKT